MSSLVITNCPRAPDADRDAFATFGVPTIHEAQGRTGYLGPSMRPSYRGARVVGTAVTVSLPPGDNWTLYVAVEQCREGDVIVAVPSSSCLDGYSGELLAVAMRAKGVRGLVIEAGLRDTKEQLEMEFPAWSCAVSAQGTVKHTVGSVNIPVVCAGQLVHPGDIVVGDDDGVVIVPRGRAAEVADLCAKRDAHEETVRTRLKAGESSLDVYGLRDGLAAAGLTYQAYQGPA